MEERVWSANHFSYVNPRESIIQSRKPERRINSRVHEHTRGYPHAFLGDPATMPRPNPYRVSQRTLAFFFHVGTHYQNGLISFSALSPPSYWNFFSGSFSSFLPSFLYPCSSKNLRKIRSIDPVLSIIKRKGGEGGGEEGGRKPYSSR